MSYIEALSPTTLQFSFEGNFWIANVFDVITAWTNPSVKYNHGRKDLGFYYVMECIKIKNSKREIGKINEVIVLAKLVIKEWVKYIPMLRLLKVLSMPVYLTVLGVCTEISGCSQSVAPSPCNL